jgi:predicted metalloprotease
LKDYAQFRDFSVSSELGTVVWANGADIAAEYFADHLVSRPDPS